MPKAKRTHGPPPKKSRKMHTFAKLSTSGAGGKPKPAQSSTNSQSSKKAQNQAKQRKPIVPFGRGDRILLVGEGDFSFARSLVTQHKCRNLLATCYDDQETLRAKYPQAERDNIPDMLHAGHRYRSNDEDQEAEPESGSEQEEENQHNTPSRHLPQVLYSVDARKLGSNGGGGKDVRNGFAKMQQRQQQQQQQQQQKQKKRNANTPGGGGPWDIICFNFPHVGGLSTDVNRQVRSNQELLVGFFKAAVSLLSVPDLEGDGDGYYDEEDFEYGSDGSEHAKEPRRTQPGQILVTLFESEPYTLWNIKDLARHAGLRVVTSFRFPWSSYEGYAHARTLGEVEGKHGGKGGWKGEDRDARMYVFENAQVEEVRPEGRKKKRGRNDSDSEDSD